jgi:hypothetical protein
MGRPSEDTLGPVNEDLDGPLPGLDAQYIAALFPNKRDSVSSKKKEITNKHRVISCSRPTQ